MEEIGADSTRYLILGPDRAGKLLELVVLDRPQGPAVIRAMAMRTKYRKPATGRVVTMSAVHGTSADGTSITDEAVEAVAVHA